MSVIQITKENFDDQVVNASGRVLLDFWAPWCGPCRMLSPVVEEIAEENEAITVGKVNIDEEMDLAVKFGVSSIPTLILMEGGKAVTTAVGFRPKAEIEKLLDL